MTGSWRPEVPPANTNTQRDSESKRVTYLLVGTVGLTSLMTKTGSAANKPSGEKQGSHIEVQTRQRPTLKE